MANSNEVRPLHKGQHQVLRVPQGLRTPHGQLHTTQEGDRILNTARVPQTLHILRKSASESGSEPGSGSAATAAASSDDNSAPATPWRNPSDLRRIRRRGRIKFSSKGPPAQHQVSGNRGSTSGVQIVAPRHVHHVF